METEQPPELIPPPLVDATLAELTIQRRGDFDRRDARDQQDVVGRPTAQPPDAFGSGLRRIVAADQGRRVEKENRH